MTHKVILPELGENIETADVAAVLVAVGDRIHRDQPVIEVETEKASLEVPAAADGTVVDIRVQPGDSIKVGQVILVLESVPAVPSPVEGDRPAGSVAVAPAAPLEAAAEAEPGAAAAEPDAPVLAFRSAPRAVRPEIAEAVPAAPSVRALARELGIDVAQVPGSGSGGRITREDVKGWAKRLIRETSSAAPGRPAGAPALPDFSRWGPVSREPLPRLRSVAAANLERAWTVPQVTQFDHADITHGEALRGEFNRRPEAAGAKLTITALVLKTVAAALERFPRFNASLDLAAEEIVYRKYVHLGVAVDTERGLLVPVVRDVGRKPLLAVAAEVAALAARARDRKLMPDEMAGACFTVSNLGGLGTTYFSPIVNWPEVAILGLGRAETQAVHEAGRFRPRSILPLSLSYDHRLIDGADAARFLRWIAEALEQPLLMLLGDDPQRTR